jgi:hypothetical protein
MQGSVLKMEHILTLRGILAVIFHNSLYITGVESVITILLGLCCVRLGAVLSSQLNFKAYICEKIVHRFIVIFIRQMKVLP